MNKNLIIVLLLALSTPAFSQFMFDIEGGAAFSGYNKIRIPGDDGTYFNAHETLDPNSSAVIRLRAGYRINNRHNIFVLYAPLKLNYTGQFDQQVDFDEGSFAAGSPTDLTYVFNSYRITYRYDFVRSDKWRLGAGFTAKIRDAYIDVEQPDEQARKSNFGFVPIINLYAKYALSDRVHILLEGDGLASAQGRAFDFELALPIYFGENWHIRPAYRILEGGADNDEVYNFSLIHYALVGVSYNF
jgi:hypothetical protein